MKRQHFCFEGIADIVLLIEINGHLDDLSHFGVEGRESLSLIVIDVEEFLILQGLLYEIK